MAFLSFTVTLVQCHSDQLSCTHLLSAPDDPITKGDAQRGDPGLALHSSQGLRSAWQRWAPLTMFSVLEESVLLWDLPWVLGESRICCLMEETDHLTGSSAADKG